MNQQQHGHCIGTDCSGIHVGLKYIDMVPNLQHRFCCCQHTKNCLARMEVNLCDALSYITGDQKGRGCSYYITLLLFIALKIPRYKLQFIASWLKFKFRECDVRRMSTRRRCDVTLLETAHLYPWVASWGLQLIVIFELLGILTESNIPPFFEHNMRFFYLIPQRYVFNSIGFCPIAGLKCVFDRPFWQYCYSCLINNTICLT